MLINEMRHFANCVSGREKSVNDIAAAKKTLELALACHRSAKKKGVIYL